MRYIAAVAVAALATVLHLPAVASGASIGGVWTKTTHPDPKNISVFYMDAHTVKAIGYGMISGPCLSECRPPPLLYAHPNFNSIPWARDSFPDQFTVTVWRRM